MTAREILDQLPKLSVLVVGDLCLDRWCTYDPGLSEPSRETGFARIPVVRTVTTAGAAGTVANNLIDLGAGTVAVLSVIGDDGFGFELTRALGYRNISTELLVKQSSIPTFTYTKLINAITGQEDLPRVDFISSSPVPEEIETRLIDNLRGLFAQFDLIIVSDQAETESGGIVTPALRRELIRLRDEHPAKLVLADSRVRITEFRRMILKPNQQEAEAACQRLFGDPRAFEQLRAYTESPVLMVTHGGDGVWIGEASGHVWQPTRKVDHPVDICGAGDSFAAGAGLALAVTGSAHQAAWFGNLVASITIMKSGTGTATPAEVIAAAASEVLA